MLELNGTLPLFHGIILRWAYVHLYLKNRQRGKEAINRGVFGQRANKGRGSVRLCASGSCSDTSGSTVAVSVYTPRICCARCFPTLPLMSSSFFIITPS